MKVIQAKRSMGKTMSLIRMADGRNGYIVCFDDKEARRIVSLAEEMKCNINMPITFEEFRQGRFNPYWCKRFFIDNADMLLRSMGDGADIVAITMAETL